MQWPCKHKRKIYFTTETTTTTTTVQLQHPLKMPMHLKVLGISSCHYLTCCWELCFGCGLLVVGGHA
jgi:hypothetical protein